LITSLLQCRSLSNRDIYIFSDGASKKEEYEKVLKVRDYLLDVKKTNTDLSIKIIESKENKGLANSIISGVTKIINEYEAAIVIEDDNIVSPFFLEYMDKMLQFHRNDSRIFAIGAYSFPFKKPKGFQEKSFLSGRISSYAWGTWVENWNTIDWEVAKYKKFKFNMKQRKEFNKYGNDRALMLDKQKKGLINSWAIRFEFEMFLQSKYCVLPVESLVKNTGNDGSGTHSSEANYEFDTTLTQAEYFELERLEVNDEIAYNFSKKYNYSVFRRFMVFIVRILLGL